MKRIATPMIGGFNPSFILALLVYPASHEVWRSRELRPMNAEL